MALIDVVSWDDSSSGPAGFGPLFAWKFPETNLSTFTQLLVRESQEVVLFTKGQLLGKFGPGKHTLNTENLPLLRSLYGLPFGNKNPFLAEVWFVNKVVPLNIDWDTTSRNPVSEQSFSMMYQDPDYGAMVPVRAVGRYGLKVVDAERFLIKLVGAAQQFYATNLTEHFRGAMNAKTKTVLLSYMQSQRIGIKSISGYLEPLSQALKSSMLAFWEDYGFNLEGFYITSVEIDSSSVEGQRILEAIARQSAQLIGGYSWQQAKAFEVAEKCRELGGQRWNVGCPDDDQHDGKWRRRSGCHAATFARQGSGLWSFRPGWIWCCAGPARGLLLKLLEEILKRVEVLSSLWRSLSSVPALRDG
jgi:membrane protease subunit (stomatin/prohibitin family)